MGESGPAWGKCALRKGLQGLEHLDRVIEVFL